MSDAPLDYRAMYEAALRALAEAEAETRKALAERAIAERKLRHEHAETVRLACRDVDGAFMRAVEQLAEARNEAERWRGIARRIVAMLIRRKRYAHKRLTQKDGRAFTLLTGIATEAETAAEAARSILYGRDQ